MVGCTPRDAPSKPSPETSLCSLEIEETGTATAVVQCWLLWHPGANDSCVGGFWLSTQVQSTEALLHTQGKAVMAPHEHGTSRGCPPLNSIAGQLLDCWCLRCYQEKQTQCFEVTALEQRGARLSPLLTGETFVQFSALERLAPDTFHLRPSLAIWEWQMAKAQ